MTDRKKPGWALWALSMVTALMLSYPLAYVVRNILDNCELMPNRAQRIADTVFRPLDEFIGSGG